ncbi:molybdopterin-dependent oxidoreductase [Myxococcota bacterium]|nr:molybdopterin-dependent oxidoreductase [Myxococcota bacterium]MCZ7619742.1 molybdopterin-dependent oxidoreductase [Myxococcota bacterium]
MTDRQQVATFCRVCEPACGLVAELEEGALVGLRPDRQHPVTRGFACHKGIAGVDIHRDPDRLGTPLRRDAGGRFVRASWDEAIDGIAGSLRAILDRDGPEAVGFYLGNPTAFNTLAGPQASAFFAQLGARRAFSSGTQDCANKFAGSEAVFGSSTIHPIPDLRHTELLLVLGENPRVSHMSFVSIADPMQVLRDARARGARIVFVNPRRIESATPSTGDVLLIRPDTDLYLLAALLHEIDRLGGFDEAVLERYGKHVAELRAFLARHPAERAACVTGIEAETIRQLAGDWVRAGSASVHMSTGVNMGRQGTLAYWLVHMLSFVTGNLDRRGGNLLSRGFYASAKAGRRAFDDGSVETEFGRVRRGPLPGTLLPHFITRARRPLRALFVVAGNPVLSIGGEEALREAFAELELLVCIDLYRNATAESAHWLLPATDMFERADINITGLGLQHDPWVQWTPAVVPPRDERREEWWIFARLAQALGLRSPLDAGAESEAALWGRVDHMLQSRGSSLEALRASRHGVRFEDGLEPGHFFSEQLQTADGRVDCCPPGFAAALERAEAIYRELDAEGPRRLKLITRRDPFMHNSWYANVPALKRGTRDRNYLYVHPEDLAERGLEDGAKARVWNEHGGLEVELRTDADLMRGVAALTHGWGNARTPGMRVAQRTPGVNANALLPIGPGSYEELSNQAFMTGIPIELTAL